MPSQSQMKGAFSHPVQAAASAGALSCSRTTSTAMATSMMVVLAGRRAGLSVAGPGSGLFSLPVDQPRDQPRDLPGRTT